MDTAKLVSRFLDVIEKDVAPKTGEGVKTGNKVFGAAILKKDDLSLVIADTNQATKNPLWHGEVHTICKLYERDRTQIPDPKDCIFLATHEPCSLCLSAITWAGFDNFYYLFSYEDSRDSFAMPYDIQILKEVFQVPMVPETSESEDLYNRKNAFWTSHYIIKMIETLEPSVREPLLARVKVLVDLYAKFATVYQESEDDKGHLS